MQSFQTHFSPYDPGLMCFLLFIFTIHSWCFFLFRQRWTNTLCLDNVKPACFILTAEVNLTTVTQESPSKGRNSWKLSTSLQAVAKIRDFWREQTFYKLITYNRKEQNRYVPSRCCSTWKLRQTEAFLSQLWGREHRRHRAPRHPDTTAAARTN